MQHFSPYNTYSMSDHIWMLKRWQAVGYPSAIIGGGAVRDIYFRRPPNDIDIFYNKNTPSIVTFESLIERGILHHKPKSLSDLYVHLFELDIVSPGVYDEVYPTSFKRGKAYHYNRNRIVSIKTVMKEGKIYQFIALDMEPVDYALKHFDTGICMCYCDGKRFHYTNEFLHDAVHRTITICGDMTRREYDYSRGVHIKKLQRKFPDFKIVDKVKDKFTNYKL